MYKLKTKYKGLVLTMTGRQVILDNVKSEHVELMKLEKYFTKTKKEKKDKTTFID
tara:strand:- start:1415 stop:1579 length:165 start_codon:yes stop_codon:yes gene_type:complete